MMYTASEKLAIIRLVEESELSIRRTLQEIKVRKSGMMKYRLATVLAWWAFLHTAAFIVGLVAHETGLRTEYVPVVDDYLNAVSAFSGAWLVGGLPPTIWVTLFIWTGNPRFLPWRK